MVLAEKEEHTLKSSSYVEGNKNILNLCNKRGNITLNTLYIFIKWKRHLKFKLLILAYGNIDTTAKKKLVLT